MTALDNNHTKIKMLVVYTSFITCGGVERFLLNFFELFPSDKYQIDLLLFNDDQDNAKMFDMIPKHVNVLPFLKQYSRWSPELMEELDAAGQTESVKVKNFIHDRNMDAEFKRQAMGVRFEENWSILKTICPEYSGYDVAIAFTNMLPLKIVADKVSAKKKFVFLHLDMKAEIEFKNEDSLYQYEKAYYDRMNGIVCIAKQNAESFCSYFPDLADRVKVLININNKALMFRQAEEFYPQEYQQCSNNLLTIARIHPQKGIELLIQTAGKLKDAGIDFRWFVLGSHQVKAYTEKCQRLIETLQLQDHVFFLGERPNPFPYYKNCTLYVQTSVFEGRPLSIEEAMSMNCPIVTTDFSSVREQIEDGINGRVCSFDAEQLAAAIIELLQNSGERTRLSQSNAKYDGTEGINKYLEYFS
ncbi:MULTISPECIES: glycosyltransferase [unclassified Paenibacillus]|uniref:glycosyltransferase n=1 Tax=unclassified Paenibacillus TaxID=185978 RepID=UPI002406366C|nr:MULTISPECIES: glycosyltransferase [unclassified Paenibacillus]MDF9843771.1 glycosyltransferase involved in cell wall biosynthesis [Paenibacillus sp. PastF-2]MDF9850390.1 glycosyltransferase involved in cell wall biosynthesis [Paenibacillus sp. PastM-2]MDF9856907.1 glycosyltransferase involved in cell wall biosynthesis [Paenibacillus sp. PastF-1]MDH6482236.1 glycosyltransferase involved in cell wall biosynthesis [Paenibacillus sp. PastH-2]MDH6509600.1 glycosyltransferase involved in cell wal